MKSLLVLAIFFTSNTWANTSFLPKSFSANFEQSFKSAISGKKKSSTGEISYLYPGNLKLEVNKPDREIFVSNSKKTYIYTPPWIEGEQGQVQIRITQSFGPARFFDILKNGLVNNKFYNVTKDKKISVIHFKKEIIEKLKFREARLQFHSVKRSFDAISTIKLIYKDGKSVDITLSKLNTKISLPQSHFHFKVPANTKIVK